MLKEKLIEFINNTESPDTNWNLALEYHKSGQGAAALTYYLRCAARTPALWLQYKCLLQCGRILQQQGNRDHSVLSCWKKALAIGPHWPEAHFLLAEYYTNKQQWLDGYMYSCSGLSAAWEIEAAGNTYSIPLFRAELLFNRAVCSYWVNSVKESREYFVEILTQNYDELNSVYKKATKDNLCKLFCGMNENERERKYTGQPLKQVFPGSKAIKQNYSQVFQDMFVISMFNGKKNGTWLELGCGDPYFRNNTALLEKAFDWSGISIDMNEKCIQDFCASDRKNTKAICKNATEIDFSELLKDKNYIDYLQVDIDPGSQSLAALKKFPFSNIQCGVITFEHDDYCDPNMDKKDSVKKQARKLLTDNGYVLWVENVSSNGLGHFEDWYINPKIITNPLLPQKDMTGIPIDQYFC